MRKLLVLTALFALVISAGTATAQASASSNRITGTKLVYTHDFITATRIVGKYYGSNVERWLQSCSASEGGHGGWIWFGHNTRAVFGTNTPGGWMQFMESTFDNNVDWAFRDARSRGLRWHPQARFYSEPLGQAIVAGAMYYHHGNTSWTGSGC